MKMTFVFDGLQFGGIERVGLDYIKLLLHAGHQIDIINLKPSLRDMEKEIPKEASVCHIRFPRAISPERYRSWKWRGLYGQIAFAAAFTVFTVIQSLYRPLYAHKLQKTDLAIAFAGHYNDLTFVSGNFRGAKKIAWLHGNEYSYEEIGSGFLALYRKIRNLVCLSCKDDEKIAAFNARNHIRKVQIYNPINLAERTVDAAKVAQLRETMGDFVLMVGRMEKDKDQATLIRAIKALKERHGLCKRLVLVGDGNERARLEALVSELALTEQVIFTGARYDVQNYYSAAYVYAHSSPAEGLPTAILEAMYYHLPVIATNSEPGVREILQDTCGLITPVGDAEQLADSLYRLYTDRAEAEQLVASSDSRIKAFMPEHVIEQLLTYIEDIGSADCP